MKATHKILAALFTFALIFPSGAYAQLQLGKKKGPTSKLFLAESKGKGTIQTGGRIYEPKQASAFDAPGTIIETKGEAYDAFVYSNGTGMYIDANTRVEIDRFVQEPFQPDRNNAEAEPSISQSDVFIAEGFVGICTSQLVSGTSMIYSTPQASINIRGQKVAMQVTAEETIVYLLEGDVTVRSGSKDVGGTILHPGEQAVVRAGTADSPPTITVSPIDKDLLSSLDDRVAVACNAKKTVSFETGNDVTGNGGETQIIANPTTAKNFRTFIAPSGPTCQL